MASCCACCDEPEETRPLLADTGKPVRQQPKSARKSKHASCDAGESPLIVPIDCKPVKVANVDKRLQDHAVLYNEHLIRNQRRKDEIDCLREMSDGADRSLNAVFTKLAQLSESPNAFTLKRKIQYCMKIEYDRNDVDSRLVPAFEAFNKANKLTKEIMDKGPPLINSIELVLNNERELRRDVLVASLGAEGPDCMKNCMDNIAQLKKVPAVVEAIKKETVADFEEMIKAVQIILQDRPTGEKGVDSDANAKQEESPDDLPGDDSQRSEEARREAAQQNEHSSVEQQTEKRPNDQVESPDQ